jgi:hypothetical protein
MGGHRLPQPIQRLREFAPRPSWSLLWISQGRVGHREGSHRRGEGRDAAAIGANDEVVFREAQHLRDDFADAPLQGMVGFGVRLQRVIEVETGREHARVLTRALALERGLRFQTEGDPSCLVRVGWWRHAAAQGILIELDLGQHARHTPLVGGCRVVRGTGERQVFGDEAKGVCSATLDERNRLERFRRGSEVGNMLRITVDSEQSPGDVGNDDDTRVGALDGLSPSDFRQRG